MMSESAHPGSPGISSRIRHKSGKKPSALGSTLKASRPSALGHKLKAQKSSSTGRYDQKVYNNIRQTFSKKNRDKRCDNIDLDEFLCPVLTHFEKTFPKIVPKESQAGTWCFDDSSVSSDGFEFDCQPSSSYCISSANFAELQCSPNTLCHNKVFSFDEYLYFYLKHNKEVMSNDCVCGECNAFMVSEMFVQENFLLVPALNGLHGEATNSDDVSEASIDQANRQRKHKEAKNKIHSKNFSKSKVKDGPMPVCKYFLEGKCSNSYCRYTHIKDESLSSPPVVKAKVIFAIQGIPYFFRENKFHLADLDDSSSVIETELQTVPLPQFYMFGTLYLKTEITFSVVLYNYFTSKLGVLSNNTRNKEALERFMLTLSIFPRDIVRGTGHFYAFRNLERCPQESILVQSDLPHTMGISVNIANIRAIPCEYSPNKFGYAYNYNWKICRSKGFTCQIDDGIVTDIRFATDKILEIGDRNYRAFFNFTPRNAFQVYAPCGKNVCGALSRYFKCTFSATEVSYTDHDRRQRQINLLPGFGYDVIYSVCKLCDAKVVPAVYVGAVGLDIHTRLGSTFFVDTHGKKTFKKAIDKILDGWPAWFLWLYWAMYVVDVYGVMWNSLIFICFTPVYYLTEYMPLLGRFVKLPHPKRLLYQTYFDKDKSYWRILNNEGSIESKYKWEFGKVGKEGRLYATGQWLALADYFTSMLMKYIFKKEVLLGTVWYMQRYVDVKFQYCDTQERKSSDEMFLEIRELPIDTIKLYFFSDDGFLVSTIDGIVKIYETDFSSCDASNGLPIFAAFYYIGREILGCGYSAVGAERIIQQCAMPTRVYNPCSQKSDPEFVELLPETFFQYSGNNGTTCYNNIAEVGFICGIYDVISENPNLPMSSDLVRRAAERYGWKVTIIERKSFNSSTFLKRAFNGKVSWLVYGAMLRSFGKVDGIPRGEQFGLDNREFRTKNNQELTELLIEQQAKMHVNEPTSPVVCAIRYRARMIDKMPSVFEVSYDDLNDRYGTVTYEWYALIEAILNLQLGDVISSPVLEKIFSFDYGVSAIFEDNYEHDPYMRVNSLV